MKKAKIYALSSWFGFLLLLLWMTSCNSKKVVIQKEITKDTIVETIHDTLFTVEKDSSYYHALLECQNGKVVIKQIAETSSGRKLKTPKVVIDDNELKVDCFAEAEQLFASWKSTFVSRYKELNKPIVTNELTWWQETQIIIGRLLFFVLVLLILLKLFKFNSL